MGGHTRVDRAEGVGSQKMHVIVDDAGSPSNGLAACAKSAGHIPVAGVGSADQSLTLRLYCHD